MYKLFAFPNIIQIFFHQLIFNTGVLCAEKSYVCSGMTAILLGGNFSRVRRPKQGFKMHSS